MRTRISMALIIILAIFFGGCAAAPPEPITKEIAPTKPARIDDLDSKLTDLTNQIINSLTETKRTRIAIIEFSDLEGNITEFGKYLSEELITRLFMTRRFVVVERQFLNKIIQEHKLTYTHFFDEESIKEIGKFLGVSAIASGSLTDLGRSVKVNARLIATETGSIFAVAAVEILKDEKVAMLLAKKARSPYYKRKIAVKVPEAVPSPVPEKPAPKKLEEKPTIALQRVETHNFTFEVKECKISGTDVACKLVITNNNQDRELQLNNRFRKPRSRIFDDSGNEYILEYNRGQVQIGNKKGQDPKILLVSGIATKAIFYFEKVSTQAKTITLMDLSCGSGGKDFRVQFRNISLSK